MRPPNRGLLALLLALLALPASVVLSEPAPPLLQPAPSPTQRTAPLALDTAFTYQGRLVDGAQPANGSYDFHFTLHTADVGGSPVGSPIALDNVPVVDGQFTVQLDFGNAAFDGHMRYLEIAVRFGESTDPHTTLAPRQPLTPAPQVLYASQAGNAASASVLHGTASAVYPLT